MVPYTNGDRVTRMALSEAHVHVLVRQSQGAMATVPYFDYFVAGFRRDFNHGERPVKRVHAPRHVPDNGAYTGPYWSMGYIDYHAATQTLYFTSGFRIYTLDASYGFFTEDQHLGYVPWADEDKPLDNALTAWGSGISIVHDVVYVSFGPHSWEIGGYDGQRNVMPGRPGGQEETYGQANAYVKNWWTRDVQSHIIHVDPFSNTISKITDVLTDELHTCYKTWVEPVNAEFAINSCMTNTGSTLSQPFDRGLHRFNVWSMADEEAAHFTTEQTEMGVTASRATDHGEFVTSMSATGVKMTGPGDLTYMDIDALGHSTLTLHRDTKTTSVGANLLNMGRQNFHPDQTLGEYHTNVIIGTDSGNVRGGLSRSILIGTNLMNANPNVEGSGTDAEFNGPFGSMSSHLQTAPASGVFAIGHDKPLLSGNLD